MEGMSEIMMAISSRKMPILLVEDDEVDIEAVRRALQKGKICNDVVCACDGIEALNILAGKDSHKKIQQPCLILLDINMPRMNGLDFLKHIQQNEIMKQNVVFILTTSLRDSDKAVAHAFQVTGYLLKENLGNLVNSISGFL
jgi:CheY-like chemotaxis protein